MVGEFKDKGVVVKTTDYKDADKIITLLTRNHGLISAFALGARRQNSKKSPHLDLISQVDIQIRGKEYQYIDQASTVSSFTNIKADLKKISLCMSFFEILTQLTAPGVEDPEIYQSLLVFLNQIEKAKSQAQQNQTASRFAKYLLRHMGYPERPPQNIASVSSYFENLMNRKLISKEIV
ncbi:DNA repair protein RecO [Candidatus Collierbacteria bacterium RIFOXYD1_FULL_40_9]|uniref:DNA repair protein RecO n=1 Tax=Candidatus Collierbacteria bacterium RIFOXYD1_FULL_40_9 TaxID=1817731 RepID=A0A1F5FVK7_9BACT|nr:MAG: DNA repair protein RecO [Candidatus Collierbacteria bacterium RIFOXYD1_FULL_40_9]